MSNRLYLNQNKKLFVVLSYAGGTKYFRHITETRLKSFAPVNAVNLSPAQLDYDVIQIVREPLSRYMSWFDKQYIKALYRESNKPADLKTWVEGFFTKDWIDNFFNNAKIACHYDGHTAFQSIWPQVNMKGLYRDDWSYLRMEDINPYFLNQERAEILRDPKEYVGIWDVISEPTKEYTISKIKEIYKYELEWYNSLNFIKID